MANSLSDLIDRLIPFLSNLPDAIKLSIDCVAPLTSFIEAVSWYSQSIKKVGDGPEEQGEALES